MGWTPGLIAFLAWCFLIASSSLSISLLKATALSRYSYLRPETVETLRMIRAGEAYPEVRRAIDRAIERGAGGR